MRHPYAVIAVLTVGRIVFGFQFQTVASLGPVLSGVFNLNFASLGTLIGLYMASGVVLALPYGFLGRRFGDRNTVAAGYALMVLGGAVAALAGGMPSIGVGAIGAGRVIAGAGAVAMTVLQGKIIADRFHGGRFTLLIGLMIGSFPIGVGLAQVITPRLAATFGWPAAFWAGAAAAAVMGIAFVLTWDGSRHVSARTLAWPSRHEVLLLIAAGLILDLYNAAYFNFLSYMPSFLAVHGHAVWVADVVLSLATWGNLPAILLGTAIAVRFGPMRVFMAGTLLCALAVAGPAFIDLPLLWGALFGTVACMHSGLIIESGTLSARPENRSVGMGLFYATYYLGSAGIPALCGAAADYAGDPAGALVVAAALSLLAVPFYLQHRRWQRAAVGVTPARRWPR